MGGEGEGRKEGEMALILVVDDERNIVSLARLYLENAGFQVASAYTGREGLEKARRLRPDLVILDLMLPEMDGWEVCRQLRAESDVPILMLTARDEDLDRILGLELGADDYVTKPFNPRELVARVKAILRRTARTAAGRPLRVGDLEVDLERREARVGERRLELRPREFDLLAVFAASPGRVFRREELLRQVWGWNPEMARETRTVDIHVARLRDHLEGSRVRLETVRGVGYRLVEPEEG